MSNVFIVNLFGILVVDLFIRLEIYSDLLPWRSVADIDNDESMVMIIFGRFDVYGIYIFSGMMIDNNIYMYLFVFRRIFLF